MRPNSPCCLYRRRRDTGDQFITAGSIQRIGEPRQVQDSVEVDYYVNVGGRVLSQDDLKSGLDDEALSAVSQAVGK